MPPEHVKLTPAGHLTQMQYRLLQAELGHKVTLTTGDPAVLKRLLLATWKDRDFADRVNKIYHSYGKGWKPPRGREERIEGLLELMANQR